MAAAYRLPRRYRRNGGGGNAAAGIVIAAVVIGALSHPAAGRPHRAGQGSPSAARPSPAGARAVAFAEQQAGKPYVWGASGPAAFDCSGLTWAAYTAAGVDMGARSTAAGQWASERHVPASQVRAGDLVFFAGSDGTPASPGHVGIVTDPARHQMTDAYATGYGVERDTYGLPGSKPGLTPVGFTDPAAGA